MKELDPDAIFEKARLTKEQNEKEQLENTINEIENKLIEEINNSNTEIYPVRYSIKIDDKNIYIDRVLDEFSKQGWYIKYSKNNTVIFSKEMLSITQND